MLTVTLTSKTLEPGSVQVRRLVGREALSSLYEYELDLVSNDQSDIVEDNLHELLDQPVCIGFSDGEQDDRAHQVWGVVRSVDSESPQRDNDPITHRVVIVPRVWRATQDVQSRIVRRKSAPIIARDVLVASDPTLEPEKHFDLAGVTRDDAEYRVQYEESSFAFLSRLLEDEGIGYRFTQHEEGERLVLFDRNSALPELLAIPFVKGDRPEARRDVVYDLRRRVVPVAGGIALLDYNDQRPFPPPRGIALAPDDVTRRVGAIVTSREPFATEPNGARVAQMRMEETIAQQRVYRGRSSRHELHAGDRIRVENSPFGSGSDLDLLVIEVAHDVTLAGARERPQGYTNRFVAIDAATQYRPARHTPRPRIHGLTYGVVSGPNMGVAAPVDEFGRYLVSFFYAPGGMTPWIRRVQPLAGANTGMHFPLQIGTEVAIAYIDGDPDRPVILGAVPNLLTASPVTMRNSTQNVIQTSSGARIEIDDNA